MNAQLDIFARVPTSISARGMERKRAGQDRAIANEAPHWMTAALVLLEKFCAQHRGMEFAFEDYRAFALSRGLRRPHVHQVWGSLAGMGQRMGLYEPTGEYRAARSIRTHGHPVRVLRVKGVAA